MFDQDKSAPAVERTAPIAEGLPNWWVTAEERDRRADDHDRRADSQDRDASQRDAAANQRDGMAVVREHDATEMAVMAHRRLAADELADAERWVTAHDSRTDGEQQSQSDGDGSEELIADLVNAALARDETKDDLRQVAQHGAAAADDRLTAARDRAAAAADRGAARADRDTAKIGRQQAAIDRAPHVKR